MSINNRPQGSDTTAAGTETVRNTQGPFVGGPWGGGEGPSPEKNAMPLHHAGLPGQDMMGMARSSYASAPKVHLQPGAAAAAAAAAATAIRSNAAAHAAFTAFAAQAARNAHAGRATSSFREGQISAAAAAAVLAQSNASTRKYSSSAGDQSNAGAGAGTTGASLGTGIPSGLTSNNNNSGSRGGSSSSSSRGAGISGGGHHAGAAYCLIPQPAYDDDHRHRQHQPPPPPPQLSRTSNYSSSHNNFRAREAVGPLKPATGGGGAPRSQDQQYHQRTRRSVGGATAKLLSSGTAHAADRGNRFRGGQTSSTPVLPGSHGSSSRIEPWQRPDAGLSGGGSGERSDLVLSAQVRLERSREQNRQSSKKARVRRKGEEETLREKIQSIQVCVCVCVCVFLYY